MRTHPRCGAHLAAALLAAAFAAPAATQAGSVRCPPSVITPVTPASHRLFLQAMEAKRSGDLAGAVRLYRSAADQGHVYALEALAAMYREGEGVPRNQAEYLRLLQRGAALGDPVAQEDLGRALFAGDGVQQDHAAAVQCFRYAAARGDNPRVEMYLASMYVDGAGVARDYAAARRHALRAAADTLAAAEFLLGLMDENGWGGPVNRASARRWYERAARHGSAQSRADVTAEARTRLAALGTASPARPAPPAPVPASRPAVRTSAPAPAGPGGHPGGQPQRSWATSDDTAALRRAAVSGDTSAQARLGYMYNYGHRVRLNHVEAARWYRRAAEQGHAGAQTHLGFIYWMGYEGVSRDRAAAARWYRRAAEQGSAQGQALLAGQYLRGDGVPVDTAEAIRLLQLAAAQRDVEGYDASARAELRRLGVSDRAGPGAPVTAARARLPSRPAPPVAASPTDRIDGYRGVRWGASPVEVRRVFGAPAREAPASASALHAIMYGAASDNRIFYFESGGGLVMVQETKAVTGAACEREYRAATARIGGMFPGLRADDLNPGDWTIQCRADAPEGMHAVDRLDASGNHVAIVLNRGTLMVHWARAGGDALLR